MSMSMTMSMIEDVNDEWYHMYVWFMFIYDRWSDLFQNSDRILWSLFRILEWFMEFYFMSLEFYFEYSEFYLELRILYYEHRIL